MVDIKGHKLVHADCPEDVVIPASPGPKPAFKSVSLSLSLSGRRAEARISSVENRVGELGDRMNEIRDANMNSSFLPSVKGCQKKKHGSHFF